MLYIIILPNNKQNVFYRLIVLAFGIKADKPNIRSYLFIQK